MTTTTIAAWLYAPTGYAGEHWPCDQAPQIVQWTCQISDYGCVIMLVYAGVCNQVMLYMQLMLYINIFVVD